MDLTLFGIGVFGLLVQILQKVLHCVKLGISKLKIILSLKDKKIEKKLLNKNINIIYHIQFI